jgi:hypothetical protein
MPDITMCKGLDCPKKHSCWRFTANPTPYGQSYFTNPPFINDGEFSCEYYWPIKPKKHETNTD